MLDEAEVRAVVAQMLTVRAAELAEFTRLRRWANGEAGTPEVPEGSEPEIRHLAEVSKRNVIGMVVDTFAQNLAVVGYRAAASVQEASGWDLWQRARMDARQGEVHRPALTYGLSYLVLRPFSAGGPLQWLPRSPRQLVALYDHDGVSAWPSVALETWTQVEGRKVRLKGALIDSELVYPVDMGLASSWKTAKRSALKAAASATSVDIDGAFAHGAVYDGVPVCPVVRFVNGGDADSGPVGEVAPLIQAQRALNEVNFDRHIVARFGAFPQKVIAGWSGTKSEVLAASARRVWTFEDTDVKASALPAASVEPYNSVLEEIITYVAQVAQISLPKIAGQMANLSAEALWAAEASQQRKIEAKREAFGESWELALHLAVETVHGPDQVAHGAEVIWRDTEARSFGAVIDGVVKLAQVGVPIDLLMPIIPGMTQQQVAAVRSRIGTDAQVTQALDELAQPPSFTAAGEE